MFPCDGACWSLRPLIGMADVTALPDADVEAGSAGGEVGIPAGEPIDEGMMKSSKFIESAADAVDVADWSTDLRSWEIPLGFVLFVLLLFLSSLSFFCEARLKNGILSARPVPAWMQEQDEEERERERDKR